MNGREAVVELLLGREDINSDWPDPYGQTPLSWAAENGHEAVGKLLLGRGEVNPDRPDDECQTPISRASRNGHEAMLKLLLEREDVDPDKPDNSGRTPILWASRNGHDQRSQAASPVRLGFRAAGLGFFCCRPGRTVGYSPAFRAYLTGPGRTADICRPSSDKM